MNQSHLFFYRNNSERTALASTVVPPKKSWARNLVNTIRQEYVHTLHTLMSVGLEAFLMRGAIRFSLAQLREIAVSPVCLIPKRTPQTISNRALIAKQQQILINALCDRQFPVRSMSSVFSVSLPTQNRVIFSPIYKLCMFRK